MPTDPGDGAGAPPEQEIDPDPLDRLNDLHENLTDIERELLDRDQDGVINTEYLLDEVDASREATQDAIEGVIITLSTDDPQPPPRYPDAEPVTVSVALIGAVSGLIAAASGGLTAWTETRKARAKARARGHS